MERSQAGYRRGRGRSHGTEHDGRTYLNSFGGTNKQLNVPRPVLRPLPRNQEGVNMPGTVLHAPACNNSLEPPVIHQSLFDPGGSQINETYNSRSSPLPSPSKSVVRLSPSPSPINQVFQQRHSPGNFSAPRMPIVRPTGRHWAYDQETKIKIHGIPTSKWTKDIHQALSPYGNIVRIEMQPGQQDHNAWVVFRPSLSRPLPDNHRIEMDATSLNYIFCQPLVRSVTSPINPKKSYCEFNILPAQAMTFGVRVADTAMIAMQTVQPRVSNSIYMTLNLQRKELDFQFPLEVSGRMRQHRFNLPFALLSQIYMVPDKHKGRTNFIIPFDSPPRFLTQRHDGEELEDGSEVTTFTRKDKIWSSWDTWFRETDIVESEISEDLRDKPLINHKTTATIDLGRWTTYLISFEDATLSGARFDELCCALEDHGIVIKDLDHYKIEAKRPAPLWRLLQDEISVTHSHLQPSAKDFMFDDLFASQVHLSLSVRYQLEACLSNGYLKEHSVTVKFLTKLATMEPRLAVHILEKVVDKQHVYYEPMDIFNIKIRGGLEKKVPKYCILQRSVIITPTMMHVASPVMETSNRIVRKYAADADRFIRVKFSDEKTEGALRNMPNNRAEAVFNRVRRAMTNGIVVAGRYYQFLAFGNSQFRENGAYFYAPTPSKSAEDIRRSLGNFDHIRTVAKFGARLGQCFSTTRAMGIAVSLQNIPDVERNGYNFTDGVGRLSFFLAQMAAQELGLSSPFEEPPTLFQFRLGGCKGVLALDPSILKNEVHIRPSQHKFAAQYTGLEIIRSSALATPFFNRQIIVVLSSLGVSNHVFIRKQQEMVNDYETAMSDEEVAVQKLRKHIDMNQSTLTMAGMVLDGFMKSREPFIMSLLMLWRSHTIKNLKEKARIAIEDGAFVLGCVDETATLKGHMDDPQSRADATRAEKLATLPEIFLQVDDTTRPGHYKIIEQICVLARNPSLHPGDLRVVRAVNTPALHHLKNVVVLPQTGDRDLANMCSGGDLDGDDYMVLWDSRLIPHTINVPPMDFTPEKPIEIERPVTVDDISDFFVTYMKNESLGQIAHAHLAQADMKPDGVNDYTCLELAKLHSQAVDYPKSGIPAIMDQTLRPQKYPHFMEKKHLAANKTYKSGKILGMLYDQVQLVDFQPQWENQFDKRVLEAFELDESLLQKARETKSAYDEALRRLMAKHGIRTEFEAWSVFVLAHNHESRDYKFAEEFGRTVGALKAQYRELCRESAGVTSMADWTYMGPFVAAMYTVTAEEMRDALRECRATKMVGGKEVPVRKMEQEHMPLISFPWLFASDLGKIATSSSIFTETKSRRREGTGDHLGPQSSVTGITSHCGELLKSDFGSGTASSKQRESKTPRQIRMFELLDTEKEPQSNLAMTPERGLSASQYDHLRPSIEDYKFEPLVAQSVDTHAVGSDSVDASPFVMPEDTSAPAAYDTRLHRWGIDAEAIPSGQHGRLAAGGTSTMSPNLNSRIDPVMSARQSGLEIVPEVREPGALDELVSRFGIGPRLKELGQNVRP